MPTQYKVAAWEDQPEEQIPIDELFERGHQVQDARNSTYNKVLTRVHRMIRTTSRLRPEDKYCYFKFPEVLVGCAMYDKEACVGYVLEKLEGNGFRTAFVHPSMLVTSWKHWIDDRQRAEVYARTGLRVDGMGNVKSKKATPVNLGSALMALGGSTDAVTQGGAAKSAEVTDYKPLGIYEGLGLSARLGARS